MNVNEGLQEMNDVSSVEVRDLFNKVTINMDIKEPSSLWILPVETISQSIEKFDRIYQSTCFVPYWNFSLADGASWEQTITLKLNNHE